MPRSCTVCQNRSCAEIDRALRTGASIVNVAERYEVSEDALSRHRRNHLRSAAELVVVETERLYELALAALAVPAEAENPRNALLAMREARHLLELVRRAGTPPNRAARAQAPEKSGPRPLYEQPFFQHPEWNNVQRILNEALRPHPEVREDFLRRLEQLDPANYTAPPDPPP